MKIFREIKKVRKKRSDIFKSARKMTQQNI